MANITTELIKELRDLTGISVMQCKKALENAEGDIEKAKKILKEESKSIVLKKSERKMGAGVVASYIHATGDVGSMVKLACETDFVARNDEFKKLAYDIAMHVVAMNPEEKDDLLGQEFIKDHSFTIKDLIESATQKFGERTELVEFVRLSF